MSAPVRTAALASSSLVHYLGRALPMLLVSCLLFTGCTLINQPKPTPEMKGAVFNVAKQYLEFIVRNDFNSVQQMISWPDFHERGIEQQRVYKELTATKGKWAGNDHPLVGLKVVSLDVKGDRAEILLQKAEQEDTPKIGIVMIWNGRGWLIVGDTIFGPQGIYMIPAET